MFLFTARRPFCVVVVLPLLLGVHCLVGCGSSGTETLCIEEALSEGAPNLSGSERSRIAHALIRGQERSGVDALLLLAVAEEESDFRSRARSPRNALGLMQLRPATARDVAKRNEILLRDDAQLYDVNINVALGAAYLAELREAFGSWDLAFTAYNQGPTKARRLRGRSPSSRYAARVLARYEALRDCDERAMR